MHRANMKKCAQRFRGNFASSFAVLAATLVVLTTISALVPAMPCSALARSKRAFVKDRALYSNRLAGALQGGGGPLPFPGGLGAKSLEEDRVRKVPLQEPLGAKSRHLGTLP